MRCGSSSATGGTSLCLKARRLPSALRVRALASTSRVGKLNWTSREVLLFTEETFSRHWRQVCPFRDTVARGL